MLPMLLAAAMLPSINLHPDGMPEYPLHGHVRGARGPARPATLWIGCRGPRTLALQLEFDAHGADFQVAPPARVAERPLARLTWTSAGRSAAIMSAAAEARTDGVASYRIFDVGGSVVPPSPLLALLLTSEAGDGELGWTQATADSATSAFQATFPVAGTATGALQRQIASCFDPPLGM